MNDETALPFGLATDGRMVSVADVPSGFACNCVCPKCGRRLIAKKGPITRHHFAHEADTNCAGSFESMAHKLAKQIIADEGRLYIPAVTATFRGDDRTVRHPMWLNFDSVAMETWRDGLRPDIIVRVREKELAIEVFVTHRCEDEKIRALRERALAAIEIDLSAFRRHDFDAESFRSSVLHDAPREWIFNAMAVRATEEMERQHMADRQALADRIKNATGQAKVSAELLERATTLYDEIYADNQRALSLLLRQKRRRRKKL